MNKVISLVDWNTAVVSSLSPSAREKKRRDLVAETALKHVESTISNYLSDSYPGKFFRVNLRLYSGWWSGKTPTEYRLGVGELLNKYASRPRFFHEKKIVFMSGTDGIQIGDKLAGISNRLSKKPRVHFLNTLRSDNGGKREKMVDTALTADLLNLTNKGEADQYIVLSDDDDMIPGVILAESMGAKMGTKVRILRRKRKMNFMNHVSDLIDIVRVDGYHV